MVLNHSQESFWTKDMAAMLVDLSKENHHRDWWTLLFHLHSWEWLKTINGQWLAETITCHAKKQVFSFKNMTWLSGQNFIYLVTRIQQDLLCSLYSKVRVKADRTSGFTSLSKKARHWESKVWFGNWTQVVWHEVRYPNHQATTFLWFINHMKKLILW